MSKSTLGETVILLFDMDGVVLNTPHERAWKKAAVEWKIIADSYNFTDFYVKKVAGQPNIEGAFVILNELKTKNGQTYFERKNITCRNTKLKKAREFRENLKQPILEEIIKNEGIKVYEDIVKIIFNAKIDGIPIGAVSASQNAENLLKCIDTTKLAYNLKVPENKSSLAIYSAKRLYDVFDTVTLGVSTNWHNLKDEQVKLFHYCQAKGQLLQKRKDMEKSTKIEVPYTIVFEDAPTGIKLISPADFYCIGISRKTEDGKSLVFKNGLLAAGAKIAYNEEQLVQKGYEGVMKDIAKMVPDLR